MISICFVVEGYAEEKFINSALVPYLQDKTAKQINHVVQNLNGGVLCSKLIDRLSNLVTQYDVVTTLVDLVALDAAKINNYTATIKNSTLTPEQKASQVEQELFTMITNNQNFIAHVQPHEFEAICFADLNGLSRSDPLIKANKSKLEKILQNNNHQPEHINTTPSTYPAKQLEKYGYSKGANNFALYCDIDEIRKLCTRFNNWVTNLENKIK